MFLKWLLGKNTQNEMPGQGRSFHRKTARFWELWPLPPKIEVSSTVVLGYRTKRVGFIGDRVSKLLALSLF